MNDDIVNDISSCALTLFYLYFSSFRLPKMTVCEACCNLAMFRVNMNLQQVSGSYNQQSGPSHRGHTNVYLRCGYSTLHRQSDDNPTELHQFMINIIESRVAP